MITAGQKAHWDTFGFFVIKQLFSQKEVSVLRDATIEVVNQQAGGGALTGGEQFAMGAFLERHPDLMNWVDDDRIYEIPETLLGPDFFLMHTGGAVYKGDTLWHGGFGPDKPKNYNPIKHGKIAMYFDSLKKEDGCLRVIPGSHLRPFADRLFPLYREDGVPDSKHFGVADEEIPCVALESEPGDVIVFTEPVYHSAFGSGIGRMQITAEYGSNPTSKEQIEELRQNSREYTWTYHSSQSYINSDRPRIRRMVSRLVELGCTPFPV